MNPYSKGSGITKKKKKNTNTHNILKGIDEEGD